MDFDGEADDAIGKLVVLAWSEPRAFSVSLCLCGYLAFSIISTNRRNR